jgi:hypothetical protein
MKGMECCWIIRLHPALRELYDEGDPQTVCCSECSHVVWLSVFAVMVGVELFMLRSVLMLLMSGHGKFRS